LFALYSQGLARIFHLFFRAKMSTSE